MKHFPSIISAIAFVLVVAQGCNSGKDATPERVETRKADTAGTPPAIGSSAAAAAAIAKQHTADTVATIVVDAAHGDPEAANRPAYKIPATHTITIDFTKFKIPVPKNFGHAPNIIMFAIGSGNQYACRFKPGTPRVTLTPSTLQPIAGTPNFTRLMPGQEGMVAVGYVPENQDLNGAIEFMTMWLAQFTAE